MSTDFTNESLYDTLDITYKTWEEIPVSQLTYNLTTSQICYIALPKDKALQAINEQAIPINSVLYEYIENVVINNDDIVIAVEIDTTNKLDLTSKRDFNTIRKVKDLDKYMRDLHIPLIKTIEQSNSIIYKFYYTKYKVLNNSIVKKVLKI